jgi:membrane-associated phospholipid phosphatase
MNRTRFATSRDYNRALPLPIRCAHHAAALLRDTAASTSGLLLFAFAFAALILPLDAPLSRAGLALWSTLSSDPRREFLALQQFGQLSVSLLLALAIALAAPARRRRLLDWAAAALIVGLAVNALKFTIGRARPKVGDPFLLVGPFGKAQVPSGDKLVEKTVWSADYLLGSFPSRHAAFAALCALFVSTMFPRLRTLLFTLALFVAAARVITGEHYPSDVAAGTLIALALARPAIRQNWGIRALDALWLRFVSPKAAPALPRLLAAERACE